MVLQSKNNGQKNALQRCNARWRKVNWRVPALLNLFLMLLLSGCANEPPKLTPPLPVPKALFQPCLAPDYQVKNYGDYPGYVAELLSVIQQCNGQLAGIKQIVLNE